MRKVIVSFLWLFILIISCKESKTDQQRINQGIAVKNPDSLRHTGDFLEDSLSLIDAVPDITFEEEPEDRRASGLFDDFIVNYAADEQFQQEQTVFPLPYYVDNVASQIEESDWKYDSLFINQDYYSMLFDREEDMEVLNDTSVTSVQFEWIYMQPYRLKRYYFERKENKWMLGMIRELTKKEGKKDKNDFFSFFHKFAVDANFQQQRISQPLIFITTDPEDDFSILESTIDKDQWTAFKPVLPVDRLSNINYGNISQKETDLKIVFLRGIDNGFSNTLYFQHTGGKWNLVKFEDTSN